MTTGPVVVGQATYDVLTLLLERPRTMPELRAELGLSKPNATNVLYRLLHHGVIDRRPGPVGKRGRQFNLWYVPDPTQASRVVVGNWFAEAGRKSACARGCAMLELPEAPPVVLPDTPYQPDTVVIDGVEYHSYSGRVPLSRREGDSSLVQR